MGGTIMAASDHLSPAQFKTKRRSGLSNDLMNYHLARDADVRRKEQRTGGYGGGEEELEHENGVRQPITYKEWMKGNRENEWDAYDWRS